MRLRRCRQPRVLRSPAGGQILRDRFEQALGGESDLVHGPLESHLMLARWFAKTAHLPHELPRGRADLLISGDNFGMTQGLDASAHATTIREPGGLPPPMRR